MRWASLSAGRWPRMRATGWGPSCSLVCGWPLRCQDRLKGDTIWIGQAVKVVGAKAEAPCIHTKVSARSETIKGTQFDRDDWCIAVKWWVKTANDPEERTYEE